MGLLQLQLAPSLTWYHASAGLVPLALIAKPCCTASAVRRGAALHFCMAASWGPRVASLPCRLPPASRTLTDMSVTSPPPAAAPAAAPVMLAVPEQDPLPEHWVPPLYSPLPAPMDAPPHAPARANADSAAAAAALAAAAPDVPAALPVKAQLSSTATLLAVLPVPATARSVSLSLSGWTQYPMRPPRCQAVINAYCASSRVSGNSDAVRTAPPPRAAARLAVNDVRIISSRCTLEA